MDRRSDKNEGLEKHDILWRRLNDLRESRDRDMNSPLIKEIEQKMEENYTHLTKYSEMNNLLKQSLRTTIEELKKDHPLTPEIEKVEAELSINSSIPSALRGSITTSQTASMAAVTYINQKQS